MRSKNFSGSKKNGLGPAKHPLAIRVSYLTAFSNPPKAESVIKESLQPFSRP